MYIKLIKVSSVMVLLVLLLLIVATRSQAQSECNVTVGANETFSNLRDALRSQSDWSGKTICIRNDMTYSKVLIDKGGSPNAPLVIKSHPSNSGRPNFVDNRNYSHNTKNGAVFQVRANNVVIEGIEVSKSPNSGFGVSSTSLKNPRENVVFRDIVSHHTYNSGIKVVKAKNVIIDSCVIYKSTLSGSAECNADPVCDEVQRSVPEQHHIIDSTDVTVQNCKIYDGDSVRGGTVGMLRSSGVTIRNNEIYDSEGNMTHMDQVNNVKILNNLLYDSCSEKNLSNGVYKLDEKDDFNPKSTDIKISNNLIVGAKGGIIFGNCQEVHGVESCGLKNIEISNNTVVGVAENYALQLARHNPVENVVVRNNVFHRKDASTTNQTSENRIGNAVSFGGNIWSQIDTLPSGDRLIPDLDGVFTNPVNPSNCVNAPLDPKKYRVSSTYTNVGANVDEVGIKTSLPSTEDPTLTPTPTPVSGRVQDADLNKDGQVNWADYEIVTKEFGKPYNIFDFNGVITAYNP